MLKQVVIVENDFEKLENLVKKHKTNELFLVRGKKSFENSGGEAFIEKLVGDSNITSFIDFNTNPQLDDLIRGIELFNKGTYKLILAIGGGSVLDMAKLISVFAKQIASYDSIVVGDAKIEQVKVPLVAVPTTSGSGAEATQFAVLYKGKKKYSVASPVILPNYVYLSPKFSLTASPYLTACTGLDAFAQAIESIWSVGATPEAEGYGLEVINLIWNNLRLAVNNNDEKAKALMQKASFLAGKAINITKTTAPHALSYSFSCYYGVSHGHAVAISLPYFFHFNYKLSHEDCVDKRGALDVKNRINKILNVIGVSIIDARKVLTQFFNSVGVNINPYQIIEDFDYEVIVNNVNLERLSNNPRKVSSDDIISFLLEFDTRL